MENTLSANNKFSKLKTHPKNEAEETEIMKSDDYKLDSYFLMTRNKFWLSGELKELEEECIEIINNVPDYFPAFLELCTIYLHKNDFAKFFETAEYALKKFPDNDQILMLKCEVLYGQKKYAEFEEIILKLDKSLLDSIQITRMLGEIMVSKKMKAEAAAQYCSCLKKYDDPVIRESLIKLYYSQGEFLSALNELKSFTDEAKSYDLKKIEAVCLYYKEDFKKSLQIFTELLKAAAEDIFCLMYAGDLSFRFNKNFKAETYWDKALKMQPQTPEDRAYIARIYLFISDYQQASSLIEFNLKENAAHSLSLMTRGLISICEDKFEKAADDWAKVIKNDKDNFNLEFDIIRKSLKNSKLIELCEKAQKAEYSQLTNFIRQKVGVLNCQ